LNLQPKLMGLPVHNLDEIEKSRLKVKGLSN